MAEPRKKTKRPYRSEQRDAAREATRAAIVSAAGQLLRDEGWQSFSLDAVARAAGVTRLTVYNQFGGRRPLLEAVFDAQALRGGLTDLVAAMQMSDPRAALVRVVRTFCRFWSGAGPMHGVMAAAMADSELAQAIAQRNERRRQLLERLVERMPDVPKKRTPVLVDTLFALTSFAFYQELATSRLGAEKACGTVVDLVVATLERATG